MEESELGYCWLVFGWSNSDLVKLVKELPLTAMDLVVEIADRMGMCISSYVRIICANRNVDVCLSIINRISIVLCDDMYSIINGIHKQHIQQSQTIPTRFPTLTPHPAVSANNLY